MGFPPGLVFHFSFWRDLFVGSVVTVVVHLPHDASAANASAAIVQGLSTCFWQGTGVTGGGVRGRGWLLAEMLPP